MWLFTLLMIIMVIRYSSTSICWIKLLTCQKWSLTFTKTGFDCQLPFYPTHGPKRLYRWAGKTRRPFLLPLGSILTPLHQLRLVHHPDWSGWVFVTRAQPQCPRGRDAIRRAIMTVWNEQLHLRSQGQPSAEIQRRLITILSVPFRIPFSLAPHTVCSQGPPTGLSEHLYRTFTGPIPLWIRKEGGHWLKMGLVSSCPEILITRVFPKHTPHTQLTAHVNATSC